MKKAPAQFTTFELVHNFRSLSGIVRYADSIVQAIYRLFPDSIDVMNPESAEHEGLPPVIFEGINDETGFFEKFLLGSRLDSPSIIFIYASDFEPQCIQSGCIWRTTGDPSSR